jgi:hypothetical protein
MVATHVKFAGQCSEAAFFGTTSQFYNSDSDSASESESDVLRSPVYGKSS